MSFSNHLRRIAGGLQDFMGVALVGMDGIVVEELKADDLLDLSALTAEFSTLLRQMDEVSSNLHFGQARELCFLGDKGVIVVKRINAEYFLLLVIQSEINFGKSRFLLKKEIAQMEKDL